MKNDLYRFEKAINDDSLKKLEYRLLLCTHVLEKGLSHKKIRYGYGANGLLHMSEMIDLWNKRGYSKDNEVYINALSLLKSYIVLHEQSDYDTSFLVKYFSDDFLAEVRACDSSMAGYKIIENSAEYVSFSELAKNRYSVREFSDQPINKEVVIEAIKVAQKSPSSCNRQSARVYVVSDEELIEKTLNIQGGLRGYKLPPAILVTTVDNLAYSNIEDRNIGYIDGGLFTMTLLYSLQEKGIGSCLLNTSFSPEKDSNIRKKLGITDNEIFINIIPIGNLDKHSKVCNSHRVDVTKIVKFIE